MVASFSEWWSVPTTGNHCGHIPDFHVMDNFLSLTALILLMLCTDILVGLLVIADVIKPSAPTAVAMLRRMGISVYLLTGDNRQTAQAIAKQVHSWIIMYISFPFSSCGTLS